MVERTCRKCGVTKPLESGFSVCRDGRANECRSCENRRKRESRARNAGRIAPPDGMSEFVHGSLWAFVDGRGKEVVMRVSGISRFYGFTVQGYIGKKVVQLRPSWLRANARRVEVA